MQLALVSARPPRGIRFLAEQLGGLPLAGFNGGSIWGADGAVLEQRLVPETAVRATLDVFAARGVSAWLFTADEWLMTDPAGPHLDLERRTVRFNERQVPSFDPYLNQVGKLVGVSKDHPHLARVEAELQAALGNTASAHRSQQYYLDVTHFDANKGYAVRALAAHLGVEPADVAVLGDMPNDLPMFDVAGFSVAMGNAGPDVQARASAVTGANDRDGWAAAIDDIILPRAA